ncbi:cation transporter [Clostridia bacterium]|nr:cation transporter [Clostridia bacterium]
MEHKRLQAIRRAAILAMVGNAILAVIKLAVGIATHTLSVIGDGVDSSVDILTSSVPLFASRIISREPNKEFPFGYGRAEAMATSLLAFAILYAGLQLGISSIRQLLNPVLQVEVSLIAIIVTIISIFGKSFLAFSQIKAGRKTQSNMLVANGKNMTADILISVSVLAGLLISHWTGFYGIDAVVTLLISILIIWTAISLFMESNKELMDGLDDTEIYKHIAETASSVEGVEKPHRMRVRKVGVHYMVYMDIELPATMDVARAHQISQEVERKITEQVEGIYDVLVHIEPRGNKEAESYGVCLEDKEEE